MMLLTLPESTGMRARHFTPMVVALALAGVALLFHTIGGWIAYTDDTSRWSGSAETISIELADATLNVPANLIRHPEQRQPGARLDRLDLAMLWPSGEGYSAAAARDFSDTGDTSPVVLVTLQADDQTMGTDERFARVLRSLAAGEALPGPGGLSLLPLSGDGTAGTDFVAHSTDTSSGAYAARCFTPRDKALAANCERTVRLGEKVLLTYRFRQAHLTDWQAMDARISALVASFGAPL